MILIGLSDVHGHIAAIDHMKTMLEVADAVFLVGDITHFGHADQMDRVVRAVQCCTKKVWGVHGNCDYPDAEAYMERHGLNLHANCRVIGGIRVAGLGGSLYTPFGTPNEYSEMQIRHFLQKAAPGEPEDSPFVLVTHQPPINTACDRIRAGRHVGSVAVREFIEQHQPAVCFSGHIHEAATVGRIGRTTIINPGPFGKGRYAYAEIVDGKPATAEIRSLV